MTKFCPECADPTECYNGCIRPPPSRSRSIKDAEAAIDLFLEYRDKHGHDEDAAKAAALNEFSEAESEEVMAALSEISHTPGEGRSTAGGALPAGTSNGAQGAAPGYPGQQFDKPHSQKVHENDCPTAWAFFNKHGLGSKLPPSCLVCGQLPADADDIAIRHMELPNIVVCMKCRNAAQSAIRPSQDGIATAHSVLEHYSADDLIPTKRDVVLLAAEIVRIADRTPE